VLKIRTAALTWFASGEDVALLGLNSNNLDLGILLLQIPSGSSHCTAGADACNQDVDLPSCVLPDLGTGCLEVNLQE
jgi:hypothetical protein